MRSLGNFLILRSTSPSNVRPSPSTNPHNGVGVDLSVKDFADVHEEEEESVEAAAQERDTQHS
jgi:hypothetical protein